METPAKYLAKILNTDEETILDLEGRLSALTGKVAAFTRLVEENERRVAKALEVLGLSADVSAEDVFEALMVHVKENEEALSEYLEHPDVSTIEGVRRVVELGKKITGIPKGFFLKRDVAEKLLKKNPPQRLLAALGEDSIDDVLDQFSLEEVFPAIRFAEDGQWLNEVFFKPFEHLSPDDFEERDVTVVVIPERFQEITDKFAGKKLHHISHLKELGVIFVMPLEEDESGKAPSGAILEVLTLVLHYLHEVPFYSRIFQRFALDPLQFSGNLVAALRGDVLDELPDTPMPEGSDRFMLIQQYLGKIDPKDARLRAPHFNPEATHYLLVEEKLEQFLTENPDLKFTFWRDLGFLSSDFVFVAKKFPSREGKKEKLISFDFVDNVISYNKRIDSSHEFVYHMKEALWNALFYSYLGRDLVDDMVQNNLEKGYLEFQRSLNA